MSLFVPLQQGLINLLGKDEAEFGRGCCDEFVKALESPEKAKNLTMLIQKTLYQIIDDVLDAYGQQFIEQAADQEAQSSNFLFNFVMAQFNELVNARFQAEWATTVDSMIRLFFQKVDSADKVSRFTDSAACLASSQAKCTPAIKDHASLICESIIKSRVHIQPITFFGRIADWWRNTLGFRDGSSVSVIGTMNQASKYVQRLKERKDDMAKEMATGIAQQFISQALAETKKDIERLEKVIKEHEEKIRRTPRPEDINLRYQPISYLSLRIKAHANSFIYGIPTIITDADHSAVPSSSIPGGPGAPAPSSTATTISASSSTSSASSSTSSSASSIPHGFWRGRACDVKQLRPTTIARVMNEFA
jgi:hypothetical protein